VPDTDAAGPDPAASSAHDGPTATDVEGWACGKSWSAGHREGDAEAFDSLARMVGDPCLAIAVRILRDVDLAAPRIAQCSVADS